MKSQYIKYKGWNIDIYYNATKLNSSFLINELIDNDCASSELNRAYDIINSDEYNQGLTFANPSTMKMIVIICESDSKNELLDTIMHELYHCSVFITKFSGSKDPEYPAYVLGDLSQKVYKNIHSFICTKCS